MNCSKVIKFETVQSAKNVLKKILNSVHNIRTCILKEKVTLKHVRKPSQG